MITLSDRLLAFADKRSARTQKELDAAMADVCAEITNGLETRIVALAGELAEAMELPDAEGVCSYLEMIAGLSKVAELVTRIHDMQRREGLPKHPRVESAQS